MWANEGENRRQRFKRRSTVFLEKDRMVGEKVICAEVSEKKKSLHLIQKSSI